MEGDSKDMKEIKVIVFQGNLAELAKSSMSDVVLKERFSREQGYTVQDFSYTCRRSRDEVCTAFGEAEDVEVDFTICVMSTEQPLFYEKLKDMGNDSYSFVYNAVFEDNRLKYYDNALMVDGYVVDIEEYAANNSNQALMRVKLLARELTYVQHDGSNMSINISNNK